MSDKDCKTCKFFESADPIYNHNNLVTDGYCRRYPSVTPIRADRWCGEWAEAKVTDEHTFYDGLGPAYKVTERENGTSVTEPVSDEERERYLEEMVHEMAETTFEFDGELTIVGIERTLPVRILNCPTKPGVIEIHDGDKVRRYVEEDE